MTEQKQKTHKKGWDAKNETYNGVYAIRKGNKIYANTGIIQFLGKTTAANRDYRTGGATARSFDAAVKRWWKNYETLVVTENEPEPVGSLKRLMVLETVLKPKVTKAKA
jgi:hypothetical protein